MTRFPDHFSDHAGVYARFRPSYPAALFDYLAAQTRGRERVWDCGTGSGQAALALAAHFESVVASDPSIQQVAHAFPNEHVTYVVATAEASPLADASCDLITIAQALHWFDTERFFAEARRVLRAGGVLAAWCYELMQVSPAVDAVVGDYYRDIVGPYWPSQRRLVDEGYRSIAFPFEEWQAPSLAIEADLDLPALLGYLDSWSAARRYRKAHGEDPQAAIRAALREAWGEPTGRRPIRWPLSLRIGRK